MGDFQDGKSVGGRNNAVVNDLYREKTDNCDTHCDQYLKYAQGIRDTRGKDAGGSHGGAKRRQISNLGKPLKKIAGSK